MPKRELRRFFQNTLILSLAAIVMRSVALSFNLYLKNTLGEAGIGLFSLVMNLFSFAITLATGGVSLLTTRLVSEALGREDEKEARAAFRKCRHYALFFGILAFLLLFSLSDFLGNAVLKDARTIPSLKALAVSLPFIALSSSFSGYFTATRRVSKSAAVQLGEQLLRVFLSVTLITYLAPKNLESLCLAVVFGGVFADIFSATVSGILAHLDVKRHLEKGKKTLPKDYNKKLLAIALPIAFSSYFRSALVTVEHLLIPRGLVAFGLSQADALAAFGVLEATVLPVILFPYALLTPFSSLLVPEVARQMAQNDRDALTKTASRALTFTAGFGIGVAALLITLSSAIGNTLCQNKEAGILIATLAPLVPIMYSDTAVDAILKGANEQLFSMRVNLADSLLGVALAFVTVPRFGLYGYLFNIILCEIVNFSFSVSRLWRVAPPKLSFSRTLLLPIAAAVLSSHALLKILPHYPLDTKFSLFSAIFLFALLYFATLILLQKATTIHKREKTVIDLHKIFPFFKA